MSGLPDIHSIPNMKSQITPTVDSEREEFRKYLESSGVLDVITRILKELYEEEEKPADLLSYFTNTLKGANFESREIVALEDEVQELKAVIENLRNEISFLREKLDKLCEKKSSPV